MKLEFEIVIKNEHYYQIVSKDFDEAMVCSDWIIAPSSKKRIKQDAREHLKAWGYSNFTITFE